MFSRKYRLPVTLRFKNAILFSTPCFTLKIIKNTFPYNRYGFVVSKNVSKNAVERNKMKRRFRACVENQKEQIIQGHDILFLLKNQIKEKKTEVLAFLLKDCLLKTGLRK
jgi:ribonuclease P protein component